MNAQLQSQATYIAAIKRIEP